MSYPLNYKQLISMKAKKPTKKAAKKRVTTHTENINLEYLQECVDDAVATLMAVNAIVRMLVAEREANK